jgi:hypothetical protein
MTQLKIIVLNCAVSFRGAFKKWGFFDKVKDMPQSHFLAI